MGERKIGETFVVHGVTYKVINSDLCEGCALYVKGECLFTKISPDDFGACFSPLREDGKSVIFVKVN